MNHDKKRLFCTSQQLSLLRKRTDTRQYLSGERFWHDRHATRHGQEEPTSPWKGADRAALVQRLTAIADAKRLAVVCAAGLGKSTNLEWLAKELARPGSQQLPFLLELDKVEHDSPESLLDLMLPAKIRAADGNSGLRDQRILPYLRRLLATGRITLLLDSIDQATQEGIRLAHNLLATRDWDKCPIVISGRPHAVFDHWDDLIVPDERGWRFIRVEPLAPEQSKMLLNQDGIDRWSQLPDGGKVLMANPRNIEYVSKCPVTQRREGGNPDTVVDFTLHDLRTASHVFAGAVDHMVRYGMRNPAARRLGCPKHAPPPDEPSERQIEFALDFLGGLALEMYAMPAPDSADQDEAPFRPNVSHVAAKQMTRFTKAVLKRLKVASVVDSDYNIADVEKDLEALAELNAEIKYDLLDTQPSRRGDFRWYDRSLQEFFATWWLSRYADVNELQRLRQWRYHDTRQRERKSLYEPLWGYLVEMPMAVRINQVWVAAVGLLFEHNVTRCCEMIYRAFPAMLEFDGGKAVIEGWRREFGNLHGAVAQHIRGGFRRCPLDPAEDFKPFQMGSPELEPNHQDDETRHSVVVSPFFMHEFPVTNAQFEVFDSGHKAERWGWNAAEPHTAGDEAAIHPVVNVTWFQAWCFAQWTGNRLPSEAEWEYACRAGTETTYNFGDKFDATRCNSDESQNGSTTAKGRYAHNDWQLYDMHGNVYEWCEDWFAENFYETNESGKKDPVNRKPAIARVLRGGCWDIDGESCRSAYRGWDRPDSRFHDFGFRLAAVPDVGARQAKES